MTCGAGHQEHQGAKGKPMDTKNAERDTLGVSVNLVVGGSSLTNVNSLKSDAQAVGFTQHF